MAIEDVDGTLLHGDAERAARASVIAVAHDDASARVGLGDAHGRGAVATLLDHLVTKEIERKALGSEVLHLYREINLIYSFSEKLAALLDVERVASLTLQEARQLIVATDGAIMLLDEASGALTSVAGFGDEMPHLPGFRARSRHHRHDRPDRRRRDRQRRGPRSAPACTERHRRQGADLPRR